LHQLNYEKKFLQHCTTKNTQNFIFAQKKQLRKILFEQKNNAKFYLHVAWAFDNCQLLDAEK